MIKSIEEGRKEDGNRSIADKIKGRLHDLEQTIENNLGRWAWELLQNAKDSVSDEADKSVCVRIELNHDSVIFKHNGAAFTEFDIRGLINQISSKEVEVGEQTRNTGRFGTGFLTTHMLSKKVKVAGVVKTDGDGKYHSFNFLLDRDGQTTAELTPKVELAWNGFQDSTTEIVDYDENAFNTSFSYILTTEQQRDIASKGVVEFSKLVPYVLTFIPKIESVKIVNNISPTSVVFSNTGEVLERAIAKIKIVENSDSSDIFILQAKNDKVAIAIELEVTDRGYSVKEIKNIPKIFCDFPLIGSEDFHLPMIVNSFLFHPLTERDGIWLKNDAKSQVLENRALLESSVELYTNLISQIADKHIFDLYNLATTKIPSTADKFFDRAWYINNIQKPLRGFLKESKIVETNTGKESLGEVYFPDKELPKEEREKIWELSSDLKVNKLPKKEHIQKWSNIIWNDCNKVDIADLVRDLKDKNNFATLTEVLELDEDITFDWLNGCLEFISDHDTKLFLESEIIPNQNGLFKASSTLFLDEIESETLKETAKLLGDDCYEYLVHRNVCLESLPKKNLGDIAASITRIVNQENHSQERNQAIRMLIQWFECNEEIGKKNFSELYGKREKLLVDTIEDKESLYSILSSSVDISEIASLVKEVRNNPEKAKESFDKAKQLDELLDEYGADSVADLKNLIIASEDTSQKKKITQETLASLGVTTLSELKVALKDKNISRRFFHSSMPSLQMFEYAQEIIQRAKSNIIKYLGNHEAYDCNDLEELAPTVIGGVLKHEQTITIVIRPSDNKQVIVYSDSEKASLEYENAELWIDDGVSDPRHLTLGKVLKNTGITKIPV
jgi:hypothetical protein